MAQISGTKEATARNEGAFLSKLKPATIALAATMMAGCASTQREHFDVGIWGNSSDTTSNVAGIVKDKKIEQPSPASEQMGSIMTQKVFLRSDSTSMHAISRTDTTLVHDVLFMPDGRYIRQDVAGLQIKDVTIVVWVKKEDGGCSIIDMAFHDPKPKRNSKQTQRVGLTKEEKELEFKKLRSIYSALCTEEKAQPMIIASK
jgi:hypothetical protein